MSMLDVPYTLFFLSVHRTGILGMSMGGSKFMVMPMLLLVDQTSQTGNVPGHSAAEVSVYPPLTL